MNNVHDFGKDADYIRREDAIEVADAVWSVTGDANVAKVWDQIKDLPSATCDDCIWHVCNYNKVDWNGENDCISRAAAIAVADSSDHVGLSVEDVKKVTDEVVKGLKQLPSAQPERYWIDSEGNISALPSAQPEQRWIPIKTRPMNKEEIEYWSDYFDYDIEYEDAVLFDCKMPEDGQEILVSYEKWVGMDICEVDGGVYGLQGNGDWDGVLAWMPSPEPYKERRTDEADYRKE